jgi:hypothetical protein
MTGQGVLFKLGAELLEQPELPFDGAAAGSEPAAAAAPLVIVGCGARKLRRPAPAGELYTGQHYQACMATARTLTSPDHIRILSAAHGLLKLDTETAPYDVKMGDVGSFTVHMLREQVKRAGLLDGPVIVLAGAAYAMLCRGVWPHAETPLAGLGIGQQRAKLAQMRAGTDKLGAAELAERRQVARIARQKEIHAARFDEARDHRRYCLRCVDGKRCRDGRKLDKDSNIAALALGAMMRGEL